MGCTKKYNKTLVDLARQSKIITGDTACFDGKIQAGIPFSGYPTGVDMTTLTDIGNSLPSLTCVFSGNSFTTLFDVSNPTQPGYNPIFDIYSGHTWSGNPLFNIYTSGLTLPITVYSALTQTVGPILFPATTGFNEEHPIVISYTGYSIQYSFSDILGLPGGNFSPSAPPGTGFTSGFTSAFQIFYSATSLDYKGPLNYLSSKENATISNELTTKKLKVTGDASAGTIGNVLTQIDEFGTAGWLPFSGASADTNTFVTSGVLNGSELELTYNTGGSVPAIDLSALSGGSGNLQSVLDEGTTGPTFPFTTSDSVGILPTNSIVMGTGNPFGSPPVSATTLVWLDAANGTINIAGHHLSGITTNDGATKISGENSFGESNIDVSGGEIDINTTGSTIILEADGNILIDGLGELTSPTIGDVLSAKDTSGRLKWVTLSGASADTNTFVTGGTFPTAIPYTLSLHYNNGGSAADIDLSSLRFSGGTGSCITDLYITNLHGCSPITVYDNLQSSGSTALGVFSIAWGSGNTVNSNFSKAEGKGNEIHLLAESAHAEGGFNFINLKGSYGHVEGFENEVANTAAHAEGIRTIAGGIGSHAGGYQSATGNTLFVNNIGGFAHYTITDPFDKGIEANCDYSAILGGRDHFISADQRGGIILGGENNGLSGNTGSFGQSIVGGSGNRIVSDDPFFGSGYSIIGGGSGNFIQTSSSDGSNAIIGGKLNDIIGNVSRSAIIGGEDNIISGGIGVSVILGGIGITAQSSNTVYVPNLNIGTIGSGSPSINLGLDSSGNVVTGSTGSGSTFSWSDPVVKAGNTSGTCITDLYITNLYGCSPITIHDSVDFNGSIVDSGITYSFVFGNTHILTGTSITHGTSMDANTLLGGSGNKITPSQTGLNNTIIGGHDNEIGQVTRSDNNIILGSTNSVISNNFTTAYGGSILGGDNHLIGAAGNGSIIGGENHYLGNNGDRSVILGGQNISGDTPDTIYVPNLNIGTIGSGSPSINLGLDSSGNVVTGSTGGGGGGGATIDPYYTGATGPLFTWSVSGQSTNYEITLIQNSDINLTNVRNGDYGTIIVHQDGTGGRTLLFGLINGSAGTHYVVNGGGGAPTLTATALATDILSFTYNGSAAFWTVGNDYT